MGIRDKIFNLLGIKRIVENEHITNRVEYNSYLTLDDVKKTFNVFGLSQYFETIKPFIRPRITIEMSSLSEKKTPVGISKIGGQPDLPLNVDWPQTTIGMSLSFIGQLNCKEVSGLDDSELFPSNGLLSFFYSADQSAWGFDPKDCDKFSVLYFENISELQQKSFPSDLDEDSKYKANCVILSKSLSLPDWGHEIVDKTISEEDSDNYDEVASGVDNQIFGYPLRIQGEMELECELVTNGIYCGDATGYNSPKVEELKDGAKDWVLLLQVGSEEKTNMMWGDVGCLYFWIKKQDLAAKRFDKAWFILQCH